MTQKLNESEVDPLDYVCHVRTSQGRRRENQDSCGHWQDEQWLVGLVADGAGGHAGGQVASAWAVHEFLSRFRQNPTVEPRHLQALLHAVNDVLLTRQRQDPNLHDMHTTLAALIINKPGRTAVSVHCGDSRLYRFSEQGLQLLTRDHSVNNLFPASACPQLDTGRHALFSALGEPADRLYVEVKTLPVLKAACSFFLCTDGFWNFDSRLMESMPFEWPMNAQNMNQVFDQMQANQPASCDNFTFLAVFPRYSKVGADTSACLAGGGIVRVDDAG
ncbi:MAG: protein phosphatase 2C domain-containing protein [Limnobacter sp.]|nr:protein phosphatase 2C domain-containing protein [Limnobacter sp.]